MKTLVLEKMPELFWEEIDRSGWSEYFVTNASGLEDEINVIIIRTRTQLNKDIFELFPSLKLIIRAGTGYDNVDYNEAAIRNIQVSNTPEANAVSAYEHTLSFIFALIKQNRKTTQKILNNVWKSGLEFNWEMSDLKVLVVGVGRIGGRVASVLKQLGADVKGVDPYLSNEQKEKYSFPFVSYEEGINWTNMITFHCPLTDETDKMFSFDHLEVIKNPVWLINVARGCIIDERIIPIGLKNKKILGIALDVFEKEPWIVEKFAYLENVILSPHVGAFTQKAKNRMAKETLKVWKNYVFHKKFTSLIDPKFTPKSSFLRK